MVFKKLVNSWQSENSASEKTANKLGFYDTFKIKPVDISVSMLFVFTNAFFRTTWTHLHKANSTYFLIFFILGGSINQGILICVLIGHYFYALLIKSFTCTFKAVPRDNK